MVFTDTLSKYLNLIKSEFLSILILQIIAVIVYLIVIKAISISKKLDDDDYTNFI